MINCRDFQVSNARILNNQCTITVLEKRCIISIMWATYPGFFQWGRTVFSAEKFEKYYLGQAFKNNINIGNVAQQQGTWQKHARLWSQSPLPHTKNIYSHKVYSWHVPCYMMKMVYMILCICGLPLNNSYIMFYCEKIMKHLTKYLTSKPPKPSSS